MPCLHLACDELTAIVRCLNSHFHAVSVRKLYDIVRFLEEASSELNKIVEAKPLLFCSTLNYTKEKLLARRHVKGALHNPCMGTAQ